MRGILSIPTVMTLLVCVSVAAAPPKLAPDEEAVERLRAAAGAPFRIRETDHFTIAYNTDYAALRPLIGRLEGTYDAVWRFCLAIDLVDKPPTDRLEVLVFDQYEEFLRYSARVGVTAGTMAGFYHPTTNVSAFCNMHNSPVLADIGQEIDRVRRQLASLADRDRSATRTQRKQLRRLLTNLTARSDGLVKKFNRLVIQHEAAHQMLFNLGVHVRGAKNPDWLVEGLACHFEVPQTDAGGRLKQINHLRLGDLREAVGVSVGVNRASPEIYAAALASGRVIPLIDLIGGAIFSQDRNENIAFRYAQAWALVYYLYRSDVQSLEGYLRRLSTRKPEKVVEAHNEIADFEAFFGPVDARMEANWLSATIALRYDPGAAGR